MKRHLVLLCLASSLVAAPVYAAANSNSNSSGNSSNASNGKNDNGGGKTSTGTKTDDTPAAAVVVADKVKANLTWKQDNTDKPVLDSKVPESPEGKTGARAAQKLPGRVLEVDQNGQFVDSAPDAGSRFKVDNQGKVSRVSTTPDFEPVYFQGDRLYSAKLPSIVRSGPSCIEILFSGVARSNPDEGTVINVDGAILAFRRTTAMPRDIVELVALDRDAKGQPVWRQVWTVGGRPGDTLANTGPVTIALDPNAQRWSLYRGNRQILSGLPLFSSGPNGQILCDAGQDDDIAVLSSLSFLPNGPQPLPAPSMPNATLTLPGGRTIGAGAPAAAN